MDTVARMTGNRRATVYHLICEELTDQYCGAYRSFGIEAVDCDNDRLAIVHDVFLEQERASALAKRLNEGEAAVEHLLDIIQNEI